VARAILAPVAELGDASLSQREHVLTVRIHEPSVLLVRGIEGIADAIVALLAGEATGRLDVHVVEAAAGQDLVLGLFDALTAAEVDDLDRAVVVEGEEALGVALLAFAGDGDLADTREPRRLIHLRCLLLAGHHDGGLGGRGHLRGCGRRCGGLVGLGLEGIAPILAAALKPEHSGPSGEQKARRNEPLLDCKHD